MRLDLLIRTVLAVLVAALVGLSIPVAGAAPTGNPTSPLPPGGAPPRVLPVSLQRPVARAGIGSTSEIARLETELRDQRQIIIQMMQLEQQHYDLLLKLIQNVSAGFSGSTALPAGDPARGALVMPSLSPSSADVAAAEAPPRKAVERTASVSGKVDWPVGLREEVYVYAENVRGAMARGRTIEIAQRDRQFVPGVAVVQRGTKVVFPNYDAVYHNVFSSTPPHPFDLGSYRAGESPRAVEMTTPGVIDVFCNMHAKMHASILVVPSALWTRVSPDGTFRLDNVPIGARKLVAWSPRTRAAEQSIDLGPGGGVANFSLSLEPEGSHSNKYGLPYRSYER